MAKLTYLKGDVLEVIPDDHPIIIPHCCNSAGGWGRGFVVAISKKWKHPEIMYRNWYRDRTDPVCGDFSLGNVQFTHPAKNIIVANMIGQEGIGWQNGVPPIRLNAIKECLVKVRTKAKELQAEIHAPRFGAGLAGASWEDIEEIILDILVKEGINVFIHDLE